MYSVYYHENPYNGKRYIGVTEQKPERRWSNGNGYKGNKDFYNDITEVGWDRMHHRIIVDGLNEAQAHAIEAELISAYDTIRNGYNKSPSSFTHKTSLLSSNARQILKGLKSCFLKSDIGEWESLFEKAKYDITYADGFNSNVDICIQRLERRYGSEPLFSDTQYLADFIHEMRYQAAKIGWLLGEREEPKYITRYERMECVLNGGDVDW